MEKKYEAIERNLCKELEALDRKFAGGQEMSSQDLEKIDKLTHAMKSLATYKAMKEAEDYDMDGMSGARGRGADGRYVSRESSNNWQSYDDGYSRGYSEAMNQMNRNANSSGHYPYPNFPRW